MLAMIDNFPTWLQEELNRRNWTQAELARRANVSRAAISDVMSGKRNIGRDLAIAISSAFNIPLDDLYRATGDLPQVPESSARSRQVEHLLSQLPQEERDGVIEYIKMRLRLTVGSNAKKKKVDAGSRSAK